MRLVPGVERVREKFFGIDLGGPLVVGDGEIHLASGDGRAQNPLNGKRCPGVMLSRLEMGFSEAKLDRFVWLDVQPHGLQQWLDSVSDTHWPEIVEGGNMRNIFAGCGGELLSDLSEQGAVWLLDAVGAERCKAYAMSCAVGCVFVVLVACVHIATPFGPSECLSFQESVHFRV